MLLTYIDRFRPQLRHWRQAFIDSGRLHKLDETELLEPDQLRPLALLSLVMLISGGIFFVVLTIGAYSWQKKEFFPAITPLGAVMWIIANVFGYIIILLIHELIHGSVFLLWGGHPYFGAKLPLALYCGARQQLFCRGYYLTVGLAPLIIISLIGIGMILFSPLIASYGLLAWIGNFSGAAGDVIVARRLLRLPADVLVEDTEAGYRAWQIASE